MEVKSQEAFSVNRVVRWIEGPQHIGLRGRGARTRRSYIILALSKPCLVTAIAIFDGGVLTNASSGPMWKQLIYCL